MATDSQTEAGEEIPKHPEDTTSQPNVTSPQPDGTTATKAGTEDPDRKAVFDQLAEKLETFYELKVQQSLHRKAECEDLVYNVVHKIIRKVQTVDTRFRPNGLVSLGMPYDGIHGDEMTEFEMMLQLSFGTNNSLYMLRDRSGKSARIQPTSSNLWQDCMEENSVYVSPKRITRVFRQYVKRAVYVLRKYIDSKKFSKLPEGLTDLQLEDEKFKIVLRINKNLRVTVQPSFSVPDCRTDMSRKDIPSSSHVVAVQLPNPSMESEKEDENNNVPPPLMKSRYRNKSVRLVWQFSFFVAEKNKMRTISDGCRIKLLRILTELRDNAPGLAKLSSYHLQTMFFHETDRLHRRRDWKESKIASRFVDLLRAVSAHLDNGLCASYFMHPPDYPDVNLFEDMERNEFKSMKAIVDAFIDKPLEALKQFDGIESISLEAADAL